ncbi:hypothetical protein POM88_021391 [Heracleum sosnowskyi]|uniref:Uncharacterized protein n=1 Tax=Heracleum sosnowskyi TaxID=360622 RepID=A0AAD8MSF8_9APIA|nr:hypothetical protein POM88_021391 [Heracleum sosnowskyi]
MLLQLLLNLLLFSSSLAKSGNKNLRSTSPSSTVLIGGVAYGSYARKIVGRILNSMQALHGHAFIEDHPEHLVMALTEALALVGPIKSDLGHPTVEESDVHGNFDIKSALKDSSLDSSPIHLVVTVNGIIGCVDDWRFAAKQLLSQYPRDVIVHCDECNYSMLTFDGIDVMGSKLADKVVSVVKCHPDLKKISIIGHSLGGLIARYAIAKLYSEDFRKPISQDDGQPDGFEQPVREKKTEGKIAGLEPVNFISSATPHLVMYMQPQSLFVAEKPWFLSAPALVRALRTFAGQSKEMGAVKSLTCRVLLL